MLRGTFFSLSRRVARTRAVPVRGMAKKAAKAEPEEVKINAKLGSKRHRPVGGVDVPSSKTKLTPGQRKKKKGSKGVSAGNDSNRYPELVEITGEFLEKSKAHWVDTRTPEQIESDAALVKRCVGELWKVEKKQATMENNRLRCKWSAISQLPSELRKQALIEDDSLMPINIIPPMFSPPFGEEMEEE